MPLPSDYLERVYAGLLGKIIGVYLGRPFEGWSYERITERLGEVEYYVHEKLGVPLVVTDDDISGTLAFLRALPDHGYNPKLTPAQIGQSWLNYLIKERTILWWGGMGNSTEHTAYLRLAKGIPAPQSGSIELNGKVVAEQIGAQIFIDGWAMVAPGDPERAADLARRAASVSHDGEAIYGAQIVAAMEAQAFVESDLNKILDCAVTFIPQDSIIYQLIGDLREWHIQDQDWRKSRERIVRHYGYDTYGGNCHMIPNHALIIHSLLYGEDDFQKSLMIVNTCGWDTDCNSGNVGCFLGIKNGLAGIERGPDWRSPVADRLYVAAADSGSVISDAVQESVQIVNIARRLAGEEAIAPKQGARFHFELPGALQGFQPEAESRTMETARVENVLGHSRTGQRALAIHYQGVAKASPSRVATPTFIPPDAINLGGYNLMASPTLYSGQQVRMAYESAPGAQENSDLQGEKGAPVTLSLYIRTYGTDDHLTDYYGPAVPLLPGHAEYSWQIPDTHGAPIASIGIEISSERRASGTFYVDYLSWDGCPTITLARPEGSGIMWRRAWVNGVDILGSRSPDVYRLIQNEGRGLLIQGTRQWTDYRATATITPHMVQACGIAARVQGMTRYYALLLSPKGKARLVKMRDVESVLAEADFPWELQASYELALQVEGNQITATMDGQPLFQVTDSNDTLENGGVAFVCEVGRMASPNMKVEPPR